jgi:hypothetical protein
MKDINELKKELFEAIDTICKDYEKEPEFKVPGWYIANYASCTKYLIYYSGRKNHQFYIGDWWFVLGTENLIYKDGNFDILERPATPAEIESYLRKICDEKYVGKKVKCLLSGTYTVGKFWEYDKDADKICYTTTDGNGDGIWLFKDGKFAEIIPDKKPLPKTKKGIGELIKLYYDQNFPLPFITPVDEFLKDYED